MKTILQDLRYATRTLSRQPAFTSTAVLTLALGIGAGTALFTAVNALLLRPLPMHEPERLVEVGADPAKSPFSGLTTFSYPQYEMLREGNRTLTGLAAVDRQEVALGDGEYAEDVPIAFVTGNYFQVLGLRPAAGRFFAFEDDRAGEAAVVLSHGLWQRRFGGDPRVIGATVALNDLPVTVVGVAPEEFDGIAVNRVTEVWAPLALQVRAVPGAKTFNGMSYALDLIGRVGPGVTPGQARAELSAVAARTAEELPGPVTLAGVELRELSRVPAEHEGSLVRFVALLATATALVLLIAGVNVAGMLLVRATSRQREIAVRRAIGARRGRIVRQLVTEGVLLFLLGGAGGVLLAVWLSDLLLAFRWPMPVTIDVGVDLRVLGFALLLSLATGVGFSLAPSLRASQLDLTAALKGTARGGGRRSSLRSAFVVGQVTMSLLLLVGAGLFLRALQHALSIDPGFNPDRVVVASVDLHRQGYEEARGRLLYDRVLERVRQLPGVESASLAVDVPLGPGGESLRIEPVGSVTEPDFIRASVVDPEHFRTLEIPLLRGRGFTAADREGAPPVAIVNETLAERYWPGESPIGKRIEQTMSAFIMLRGGEQEPAEYEVVGVVPDGKYGSLREEAQPYLFLPRAQNYRSEMVLTVRARGDEGAVAAAIQREVHALDPSLPLLEVVPLDHLIGDALLAQRIGAILTTLFGLLGLVLVGVGIYGVMAYSVARRIREIGIRRALGAPDASVLRMVLGKGMGLTLIGLGLGLAAALGATRLISGLLYGVSATDPLTFAGVTLLLLAVALLACWLPARRATRVDPMVALRSE